MGFLNGSTYKEKNEHLDSLVNAKKLEKIQSHATLEIEELLNELTKMQNKMKSLEKEKFQLTSKLENITSTVQINEIKAKKFEIEKQINELVEGEMEDLRKLISDLEGIRRTVIEEVREDRKVA